MAEPTLRHELPYAEGRERIRRGGLRGEELLAWLAAVAPHQRERAIERLLGIDEYPLTPTPLGAELIGYTPSSVGSIVRAVFEVPVRRGDVFVDLGAGLGKAAMIAHLLSGARVRGIELQPDLVGRASARADQLGLVNVSFVAGDARVAALDDGNVFFLYLPFTGAVLRAVLQRLHAVAARRDVVVCALGFDLPRTNWLTRRPTDAFWLSIYDSQREGEEPRPRYEAAPLSPLAEVVAFERTATR
jgi:Methyltransferase domain